MFVLELNLRETTHSTLTIWSRIEYINVTHFWYSETRRKSRLPSVSRQPSFQHTRSSNCFCKKKPASQLVGNHAQRTIFNLKDIFAVYSSFRPNQCPYMRVCLQAVLLSVHIAQLLRVVADCLLQRNRVETREHLATAARLPTAEEVIYI